MNSRNISLRNKRVNKLRSAEKPQAGPVGAPSSSPLNQYLAPTPPLPSSSFTFTFPMPNQGPAVAATAVGFDIQPQSGIHKPKLNPGNVAPANAGTLDPDDIVRIHTNDNKGVEEKGRILQLEAEVTDLRQRLHDGSDDDASHSPSHSTSHSTNSDQDKQINRLTKENEGYHEELTSLQKDLEGRKGQNELLMRRVGELEQIIKDWDDYGAKLHDEYSMLEAKVKQLEPALAASTERERELKKKVEMFEQDLRHSHARTLEATAMRKKKDEDWLEANRLLQVAEFDLADADVQVNELESKVKTLMEQQAQIAEVRDVLRNCFNFDLDLSPDASAFADVVEDWVREHTQPPGDLTRSKKNRLSSLDDELASVASDDVLDDPRPQYPEHHSRRERGLQGGETSTSADFTTEESDMLIEADEEDGLEAPGDLPSHDIPSQDASTQTTLTFDEPILGVATGNVAVHGQTTTDMANHDTHAPNAPTQHTTSDAPVRDKPTESAEGENTSTSQILAQVTPIQGSQVEIIPTTYPPTQRNSRQPVSFKDLLASRQQAAAGQRPTATVQRQRRSFQQLIGYVSRMLATVEPTQTQAINSVSTAPQPWWIFIIKVLAALFMILYATDVAYHIYDESRLWLAANEATRQGLITIRDGSGIYPTSITLQNWLSLEKWLDFDRGLLG